MSNLKHLYVLPEKDRPAGWPEKLVSLEEYEALATQLPQPATPSSNECPRITDEELDRAIKMASAFDHIPMTLLHIYCALKELKERRKADETKSPQLDEGRLWSFVRDVLRDGAALERSYHSVPYEEFSARLDSAARARADSFLTACTVNGRPQS